LKYGRLVLVEGEGVGNVYVEGVGGVVFFGGGGSWVVSPIFRFRSKKITVGGGGRKTITPKRKHEEKFGRGEK